MQSISGFLGGLVGGRQKPRPGSPGRQSTGQRQPNIFQESPAPSRNYGSSTAFSGSPRSPRPNEAGRVKENLIPRSSSVPKSKWNRPYA